MLNQHNRQLNRFSKDKGRNSHGDLLLDLCKNIFYYEWTDRNDKSVGKNTCHDKTVINYGKGSAGVLCSCQNFNVDDFNPLFSDVHSAILIKFGMINIQNEN